MSSPGLYAGKTAQLDSSGLLGRAQPRTKPHHREHGCDLIPEPSAKRKENPHAQGSLRREELGLPRAVSAPRHPLFKRSPGDSEGRCMSQGIGSLKRGISLQDNFSRRQKSPTAGRVDENCRKCPSEQILAVWSRRKRKAGETEKGEQVVTQAWQMAWVHLTQVSFIYLEKNLPHSQGNGLPLVNAETSTS